MNAESAEELDGVLSLIRLVYRVEISPAFYRWRFLDNPFGQPLVTLLWDGDQLVGHYAAAPTIAWFGQDVPAAQSMTTMTHPDYRNRGVFTKLAADLYRRMESMGIRMVWGLPNTQSHYGFVTKLGWRDVALLFTMTRAVTDHDQSGELEELTVLPAGLTSLWQRSDNGRVFASRRDERYFRWRYVDNPMIRYRYVSLPGGNGDMFAVTKDYVTTSARYLEVVDYLYGDQPRRFGELLRGLLRWARERDYTAVRTWISMADPAFPELEKLGFVPKEPLAYFGARTFGDFSIPDMKWNHTGFYLTMGDSDNY